MEVSEEQGFEEKTKPIVKNGVWRPKSLTLKCDDVLRWDAEQEIFSNKSGPYLIVHSFML